MKGEVTPTIKRCKPYMAFARQRIQQRKMPRLIKGASAADYNARKTTTNWSATTAATANTDVCTLTPSVFPATGLTYTWSPACLAVPSNAGSISGPVNVCPGTIVDYSIPGVPGAIFYNWTYTGTGVTLAGTSTLPTVSLDFGLLQRVAPDGNAG